MTRGDTKPVPLPHNKYKLLSALLHLNMIYIQSYKRKYLRPLRLPLKFLKSQNRCLNSLPGHQFQLSVKLQSAVCYSADFIALDQIHSIYDHLSFISIVNVFH